MWKVDALLSLYADDRPPARIDHRDMVSTDLASFEADLRDHVDALVEFVADFTCSSQRLRRAFARILTLAGDVRRPEAFQTATKPGGAPAG